MRIIVGGNNGEKNSIHGCEKLCGIDTGGCPYLCIRFCKTEGTNCRKPFVPGQYPTSNPNRK